MLHQRIQLSEQDEPSSTELLGAVLRMLEQLSRPLNTQIRFPDIRACEGVDADLPKLVRIAQDGFNLVHPLGKMINQLTRVEERVDKELAGYWLAGRLVAAARKWQHVLEAVDPNNASASLQLWLVPSLLLGDEGAVEESLDPQGRRCINLQLAVLNVGTGPALDVVLELEYSTSDIEVEGEETISVGSVCRDQVEFANFQLRQEPSRGTNMQVVARYRDYIRKSQATAKSGRFTWPTPKPARPIQNHGTFPRKNAKQNARKSVIFPNERSENISESIANPFIIGRPVGSLAELKTVFVDRHSELGRLESCITGTGDQGTLIYLRGLRRAGKTSLVLQLRERLMEKPFIFVYIDCELLERQAARAKKQTGAEWQETDLMREVASIVAATAGIDPFEDNPENDTVGADTSEGKLTEAQHRFSAFMKAVKGSDWRKEETLTTARQSFERFLQAIEKRIILVFDEADYFGIRDFSSFARSFLIFLKNLTLGGISSIFVYELSNKFWNEPSLPLGEVVRVELLDFEDMKCLAESKLITSDLLTEFEKAHPNPEERERAFDDLPNLILTPLAMSYLWYVTGGYPFLTQLICYHLVQNEIADSTAEHRSFSKIIEIGDVKRAVQQIILSEDNRQQLDYLSLGFSQEEKQFLVGLARTRKSGGQHLDARTGLVHPVKLAQNGYQMQIRDACECASDDEFERFSRLYDNNDMRLAFRGLRTKNILVGYDERTGQPNDPAFVRPSGTRSKVPSSNVRLRVGFLWLFLRSVLKP